MSAWYHEMPEKGIIPPQAAILPIDPVKEYL
jgi:hypothetical protein